VHHILECKYGAEHRVQLHQQHPVSVAEHAGLVHRQARQVRHDLSGQEHCVPELGPRHFQQPGTPSQHI